MKQSEKVFRALIDSIDLKKYNKWIKKKRKFTEDDRFLMFTGIRLYDRYEQEKYPGEHLPPEPPEAIEYYRNLPPQV